MSKISSNLLAMTVTAIDATVFVVPFWMWHSHVCATFGYTQFIGFGTLISTTNWNIGYFKSQKFKNVD